jgi:GNAT superfamily N-acetyltransferase
MAWHVTDSVEPYAERVWNLLSVRADLNTLALTQITSTRSGQLSARPGPTFAWWSHADRTLGAVSLTPPYEMLLSVVPDGTLEDLVTALRGNGTSIPGVNGPSGMAARFAELWTSGTSRRPRLTRRLRLYGTTQPVIPDPAPGGRARLARDDEFSLVVSWFERCGQEVGDRPVEAREFLRGRIAAGLIWLWENAEGTPVALAARHEPASRVSRVGPVYTPNEHRRQGFGAAVTAACTRHALDTDSTVAVLFSDVANPTSNAVYQRIGYRPLEDRIVLTFGG